ncbi:MULTISPECIES: DUF2790 domain-containing protein [unclassified Pseudomonas]|uniref:DUF2790 domain-containing protein n=1 Tax=unclassified Pseudomonas TaxID=196821 RepID=UPI002AC8C6BF|nr:MULTISPECIES: DUF2790 domain-containing protein [unclassified Pseudomonas]MEB0041967.1 DUF2790 domain-containing protein [Pseudomonas sp. MH10]MEB0079084.1 DUF2790 domain-containing protein [Pseudomonas sp. MH10out]MEB0092109.1 DUF2790 domain-containing protein [Pseudomonas sp. CCI4.2]MEB0100466.1 DUF2790 domain-containing protein [Pseudomonas sp. CCI3.2]MEB0123616.1 DUF2790 domain-containing protein [Pseudomonas sp. CCI1.2]
MKAALLVLAMSGFCASAFAAEAPDATASSNLPVEQYTYASHLDVAKVISMSPASDACQVVPARMDYLDSAGKEHVVEYRAMGNGCMEG